MEGIETCLDNAAKGVIGLKDEIRNPWITNETKELINKRRKYNTIG